MRPIFRPPLLAVAAAAPLLSLLMPATAAAREQLREYIDRTTGCSVTVTRELIVFNSQSASLTSNLRDFVAMAPIEVNCMGTRSYFWFGYVWSTLQGDDASKATASLTLSADDDKLPLMQEAGTLRDHCVQEPPVPPPMRGAVPVLFQVTAAQLASAGKAADLHVERSIDGRVTLLQPWSKPVKSLQEFVSKLQLDAH